MYRGARIGAKWHEGLEFRRFEARIVTNAEETGSIAGMEG